MIASKSAEIAAPMHSMQGTQVTSQSLDVVTITVIITAHNEADEVQRTIKSVEGGTRTPLEFIVVDDGSTDGCCTELRETRFE